MIIKTIADLRESVKNGNFNEVKNIIEQGQVDINSNLNHTYVSSFLASIAPATIKETIQAGYAENKDSASYRAIHWAARLGHLDILEYLCKQGADINIVNFIGNTALHCAIYYRQKEAVKILLKFNAKLDLKNTGSLLGNIVENYSALHYAVLYGDLADVLTLVQHGADIDIKGHDKLTPLHLSAQKGFSDKIKFLVESKADVNCVDINGKTPLHYAVEYCSANDIKCLLTAGALIKADNFGINPINLAFQLENLEKVNLLHSPIEVTIDNDEKTESNASKVKTNHKSKKQEVTEVNSQEVESSSNKVKITHEQKKQIEFSRPFSDSAPVLSPVMGFSYSLVKKIQDGYAYKIIPFTELSARESDEKVVKMLKFLMEAPLTKEDIEKKVTEILSDVDPELFDELKEEFTAEFIISNKESLSRLLSNSEMIEAGNAVGSFYSPLSQTINSQIIRSDDNPTQSNTKEIDLIIAFNAANK